MWNAASSWQASFTMLDMLENTQMEAKGSVHSTLCTNTVGTASVD